MTHLKKKILVLGGTGMLGHTLFRVLERESEHEIYASARDNVLLDKLTEKDTDKYIKNLDATNFEELEGVLNALNPDLVINCVGVIKQVEHLDETYQTVLLNSLFPLKIQKVCEEINSKFIHISTDCVFSGARGNYSEEDFADCYDLYGRSKLLGEIGDKRNTITIRTSIIGHELRGHVSLLDWFLSQKKSCKGFSNAIFSGFPTVILSRIIKDYLIDQEDIFGIFHLSSQPISKYELLKIISDVYSKEIDIMKDEELHIDRSLNSSLFKLNTGFTPDNWESMIESMHKFE